MRVGISQLATRARRISSSKIPRRRRRRRANVVTCLRLAKGERAFWTTFKNVVYKTHYSVRPPPVFKKKNFFSNYVILGRLFDSKRFFRRIAFPPARVGAVFFGSPASHPSPVGRKNSKRHFSRKNDLFFSATQTRRENGTTTLLRALCPKRFQKRVRIFGQSNSSTVSHGLPIRVVKNSKQRVTIRAAPVSHHTCVFYRV